MKSLFSVGNTWLTACAAAAACWLVVATGCTSEPRDDNPPAGQEPAQHRPDQPAGADGPAQEAVEQQPAQLPQVQLSEAHAATVLVKVGQPFPDVRLSDLDGKEQPLDKLLGQRLTVVLFWSSSNPYSTVALGDLAVDVAAPYGGQGVEVVGINEGDTAETARQAATEAGAEYPILLDSGGELMSQLSTGRPPLIYILDQEGRILWLDIEYSRQTRRLLAEAIEYVLDQPAGQAAAPAARP